MRFEVILLEPAARFVEGLGAKLGPKVLRTLELLQHFGPHLPMPHARKLEGEDLYELRVRQSTDICRLFYFHSGKGTYVVTSGYVKKSQKTSRQEIRRAVSLRNRYMSGDRE